LGYFHCKNGKKIVNERNTMQACIVREKSRIGDKRKTTTYICQEGATDMETTGLEGGRGAKNEERRKGLEMEGEGELEGRKKGKRH